MFIDCGLNDVCEAVGHGHAEAPFRAPVAAFKWGGVKSV